MKTPAAAIAVALALASAASAQALYSPPEGDFAAAFAGTPTVQTRPAKRFADVAVRRYAEDAPDHFVVVSVQDYPDGALPVSADAGVYDRMLRSRAKDDGPRLLATRPVRLSGKPCLEGVFQDPDGTVELVRILMVGQRVYELTWGYAGDPAVGPPAATAFFSAFRLTP